MNLPDVLVFQYFYTEIVIFATVDIRSSNLRLYRVYFFL